MYTRKLHGYFRTEAPLFLPALVSVDPELGVYFLNWRAMLLNCEGFSLSVRCSLYFSRKCGEVNNLLPSKKKQRISLRISLFKEQLPIHAIRCKSDSLGSQFLSFECSKATKTDQKVTKSDKKAIFRFRFFFCPKKSIPISGYRLLVMLYRGYSKMLYPFWTLWKGMV